MILCLGTTPVAQRVMVFRQLVLDAVNRATTTLDGAAGKSVNVAKVLKALGGQPLAIGFLGGDRGEFVRATLEELGIEMDFVTITARTRQCITVIDEAAGTHTELVEEGRRVKGAEVEKLLAIVGRRIRSCQAIVMSGTLAPGVPMDLYFRCTQRAHAAGAISVLDAQGAPLLEALKAKPDLVKPNRAELAATLGRALVSEADVMSAMREFTAGGARQVVVTASREPVLAFDGRRYWRIRPPAIRALNPIGSGDAFTAALVWRLVRGDDLGEACRWACAAGVANAMTWMAGDVRRADVNRLAKMVRVETEIRRSKS